MCQKNYVLELGKIIISRRISAELTADEISQVTTSHRDGYIKLKNGEWRQISYDPNVKFVVNYYAYPFGEHDVVVITDLDSETYRTEVCFSDETHDRTKGYFDWMLHQSRKSPFTLGNVVCTAEVKKSLGMQHIHRLIEKQLSYDWGMVGLGDWTLNDRAVENGGRVLSHHYIGDEYVYVLTEADRSSTTIMLEYEY
ncbi:hypothetical protein BKK47_07245 [Rodentibacter mrazii]|uniref:Uncharacterized protein n=1 Tax=Rodentibacter mrazii TaxID=1908257 RepID=A0A1V3IEW9_9PAST|nr:hypothetical protein [Rodentibacter mrazii]OOF39159.1 hypothetical protein BKK47_07245 [Rodentibacter mrazii]